MTLIKISASSAWQIKADDTEYWKQRSEEIASNEQDNFALDVTRRGQLSDTLVNAVKESQANTNKLLPALKLLSTRVNYLAQHAPRSRMHRSALNLLINAILGNRDNKSFYLLDAAAKWIERRLPSINNEYERNALVKAKDAIEQARDTLDATGHAFGVGVITIRRLIDGNSDNKWNQIRDAANTMYTKVTSSPVQSLTADALDKTERAKAMLTPASISWQ